MRSVFSRYRPDRVRCVPDRRLQRLFDVRSPEQRRVALVLYDAGFAEWQRQFGRPKSWVEEARLAVERAKNPYL